MLSQHSHCDCCQTCTERALEATSLSGTRQRPRPTERTDVTVRVTSLPRHLAANEDVYSARKVPLLAREEACSPLLARGGGGISAHRSTRRRGDTATGTAPGRAVQEKAKARPRHEQLKKHFFHPFQWLTRRSRPVRASGDLLKAAPQRPQS